jgi:D-serine deaminase-like pyridoxal phosphate-dependent protein
MNLVSLETPCLVLDKKKVRANITKMQEHLKDLDVPLRPHGKTVKNIDILKMALSRQAQGITVSTVKEAEYNFKNGIRDIIYAVGIVPIKLNRIISLQEQGAHIVLILDSKQQAEHVAEKAREAGTRIPVLIEIDSDGHRSGLAPDDPFIAELGRIIEEEDGISLRGVLTHAGESYHCKSVEEIKMLSVKERDHAVQAAESLRSCGLASPVVSVGSTPTAVFAEDLTGVTEVRAGVFMFYDLVMSGLGVCSVDEIALSVLASVIGHQKDRSWIIIDAGWTALSKDRGTAEQTIDQGFGLVCDIEGRVIPDLLVSEVNQEHGIIIRRGGGTIEWDRFPVGTKVRVLPNHACATSEMHERYTVVDAGSEVTDIIPRIRGW